MTNQNTAENLDNQITPEVALEASFSGFDQTKEGYLDLVDDFIGFINVAKAQAPTEQAPGFDKMLAGMQKHREKVLSISPKPKKEEETEIPKIYDIKTGKVIPQEELPSIVSKEEILDNTENKFSRRAAEVTLSLINQFDELKPQEGESLDDAFIRVTRILLAEKLVVHGRTDPKTGKLINQSDTDGLVALELFKKAGVDISSVAYVEQGQHEQGKLNVDTGNAHGISFGAKQEDSVFSDTAFMDHHGKETGSDLSATELAYQYLLAIGALERSDKLDKLVEFVTAADNMTGPYKEPRNFGVSHRSVLGLHGRIKAGKLIQFFEDGGDATRELTDEQIKTLGGDRLLAHSQKLREIHMKSEKILAELKDNGFVADTPQGKMLVDIRGRVDDMAFAVSPYDMHLKWRPQAREFFRISGIPRNVSLGQGQGRGIRIRNMWMKPLEDKGQLTITVAEILTIFGFDPKRATGGLKKFIEGGEVVKSLTRKVDSGRQGSTQTDGGHLRWHGSDDDRGHNYGSYDISSYDYDEIRKKKKKRAA